MMVSPRPVRALGPAIARMDRQAAGAGGGGGVRVELGGVVVAGRRLGTQLISYVILRGGYEPVSGLVTMHS